MNKRPKNAPLQILSRALIFLGGGMVLGHLIKVSSQHPGYGVAAVGMACALVAYGLLTLKNPED